MKLLLASPAAEVLLVVMVFMLAWSYMMYRKRQKNESIELSSAPVKPAASPASPIPSSIPQPKLHGHQSISSFLPLKGILLVVFLILIGFTLSILLVLKNRKAEKAQKDNVVAAINQCREINVYDLDWQVLPKEILATYTAGDQIYIAVKASKQGALKTRIRIKQGEFYSGDWLESETKREGADEFYFIYTIPSGVANFTVEAEVFNGKVWN